MTFDTIYGMIMNMNQLKALIVEEMRIARASRVAKAKKRDGESDDKIATWLKKQGIDKGVINNIMRQIKHMTEELTKTDKAEIKSMISKELDKSLKKELKKALEDEISKALNSKATKEEIGEITKKVIKRLYKDLSFHHPYIIDRIKV